MILPARTIIRTIAPSVNSPPVADAGLDQTVVVGEIVQLDGSGSRDVDGAPLTFQWSFLAIPTGSTATLSDPTIVDPTFVPDVAGIYEAQLIVNDGEFDSLPDTVVITTAPAGQPVLDPIGDQTVALGSTLTLTLTATDPEGDPLTFSANPLPLPTNATLNAMTGVFSFTPSADQVGVIALTFSVSDAVFTDEEAITITVPGPDPEGVTELSGRLLDTNDFVLGTETPVVGATVSLIGTGVSTTSAANGTFTLTNIPASIHVLDIDTSTAILAPDSSTYAGFREEIELIAGVTNVVERPFFLPRIAAESLTAVDPNAITTVTNPTLAVTIEVPPATAKNADGANFTGELSISVVPENMAPATLPAGLEFAQLVIIQPVGVTFETPVPITVPNIDNLPPGSELDLWSLDPETGTFIITGTGRVSDDGTVIETISGGIRSPPGMVSCLWLLRRKKTPMATIITIRIRRNVAIKKPAPAPL